MKIDAHQHFWIYDNEKYPWIEDSMESLKHDFLLDQAQLLLNEHTFDGTIAVQARASWEENNFLLNLCEQANTVVGVVGWADFFSSDTKTEAKLNTLFLHNKLLGLRAMLQDLPSPHQAMQAEHFNQTVRKLQNHALVYEILLKWHQLGALYHFCKTHDKNYLIIDHLAKPAYALGLNSQEGIHWQKALKQVASMEHVAVKVSGLLTEVPSEALKGDEEDYAIFLPFLDFILEQFGSKRVIFGSDWPVSSLRGGYSKGLKIITKWANNRLSSQESANLFGLNAERIYKLECN